MRLLELLGPNGKQELEAVRPPSLGLPIVRLPPNSKRLAEIQARRRGMTPKSEEGDTTKAAMARASGMPGKDRAPDVEDLQDELEYGQADRGQAQGFIPQAARGDGMEEGV